MSSGLIGYHGRYSWVVAPGPGNIVCGVTMGSYGPGAYDAMVSITWDAMVAVLFTLVAATDYTYCADGGGTVAYIEGGETLAV